MIMAFNAASSKDFHSGTYFNKIYTVTFLDSIDAAAMNGAADCWDISADAGSGEVMAWVYLNQEATAAAGVNRYDLYIAGEGGVQANPSSTHLFYLFNALKEVRGLENFRTSGVTDISFMFGGCKSLESIDLSSFDTSEVTKMDSLFRDCNALASVNLRGFDTSNVTSMAYMFSNCAALTVLDLSSFDTRKVTSMERMFYLCTELKNIYIGDGWSVDQVTNDNAMFNCCYAIVGGKDIYDKDFQYVAPGKEYAKLREDGGFLDYKAPDAPKEYTVTYTFTGDIPEGVTVPASFSYNEGSKIKLEDAPSADGYAFNGWTTTDATVENGEFTVNNDVNFTGEWSKLYTVTYKYDERFPVPEGAMELPAPVQYKAGDEIDVIGVPYVDRHIFIGWTTEDADIAGNMFTMPENDVVIYGYYKIPVESIEIMNNGDVTLNEGEQTRLNVYVKPEDATIKTIVYETSNPDVVTVDKYGNIIAVGEGEATVTVKSADDETKSDTITVTVKKPVTEIGVTPAEVTLEKGGTEKLTVIVNDDATNKKVTFISSDEKVATVDEEGNIVAVGDGEAVITVVSDDNSEIKVTVPVTVKTPVKELTAADDFTLEVGGVKNVEARVNEDATNKELIYETSDSGVVKVDSDGNVTAVGEGTATVTVISKDNPSLVEEVIVTVIKKYKVTYEIIGEVKPEGVSAPTEKSYINGSSVNVEADLYADGYDFSGWFTEDVTVEHGSFVINKDVHFVGAFSKNVTDITVDKNEITLGKGESDKIIVTVTPEDATDKKVTFESSNPEVVEVDSNGNITAIKDGTATITVKSEDNPEAVETVTVTVKDYVENITADKTEITLDEGEKDKITVTVTPDDATDKSLTYESSDEKVVKVDENGNIEAVGEGEAIITVKTNDGSDKEITVKVTVKKPVVPVEEITVEKSEIILNPGDTEYIRAEVRPYNATNKELTYTSDNPGVAVVDEKGNLTATGLGTATITITSKDNPEIKKEITVKVEKPFVGVEDVETDRETIVIRKGETDKITATVKPDDATNQELTYKSGNEDVVRVDENGNIEAVGEGRAIITVASKEDPFKRVQILVIVEKERVPVTSVEASKEEMNLIPGAYESIVVKVNPDDATDKSVTYTSSNPDVAKVDDKGNVVAVGEGEAIITIASKDDPTKTDTIKVTVKAPEEPDEPENPDEPEKPVYTITVPDGMNVLEGESKNLGVTITPDDGSIKPVYTSSDESIVTVDADGNIRGIKAGVATISVDFGGGDIRIIPVVVAAPAAPRKHHIAFGKTDGIGWYEVSVNGGDFFPQGPNSTLEVEEGSILVVRVQDMWIDDEFDFYVNGSKVPMDPANTITVVVDGYMLIGALSMDVEVPDVDESLTIFEKIANFFAKIINWFKDLFTW